MKETRKMSNWIGDSLLLITAIIWGGGFVSVAKSLEAFSPFYLIGIRFGIASLLMIVISFKSLKGIKKADILPSCLIGCFLFFAFTFQTIGAKYLQIGKLSFLTSLNVIVVPFIAAFIFKEKIKRYNIVASGIAVVGFAFLNLTDHLSMQIGGGEVLGILCAVFFAAHIAVLGHFSDKIDVLVLTTLQMVVCCILGFICALIFEEPPKITSCAMLVPVLYLGVFSTFLAFLFQTLGQKYTSASRAAIILCMESVFGTGLSVLILKEALTVNMVIGALLILTAVIIAEYMHSKTPVNLENERT